MSDSLTFECQVHLSRGRRGRKRLKEGTPPQPAKVEKGRIPRISRLMALAIHLDGLIRRGEIDDMSEIARLGHVTPARVSQIMALVQLAPTIQRALLFSPSFRT